MGALFDKAAANPIIRFAYRAKVLADERSSVRLRPRDSARFLLRGNEVNNFTYEIENMGDLAAFVRDVTGAETHAVDTALGELATNRALMDELRRRLETNPRREAEPRLGYRRAAHAIVRLTKPRRVIEIGTHDGLGSVAIAAALAANASEGSPGELHTLDINPRSGWLVPEDLEPFVHLWIGEVAETLPGVLAEGPPDFVFQDVGHAFEHRSFVFERSVAAARDRRLVLMSEIDGSPELPRLCEREGAPYFDFTERPRRHFWHGHTWGAGIFAPSD